MFIRESLTNADCVGWVVNKRLRRPHHSHSQADTQSDVRRQTSSDGRLQCHAAFTRRPQNGRQCFIGFSFKLAVEPERSLRVQISFKRSFKLGLKPS